MLVVKETFAYAYFIALRGCLVKYSELIIKCKLYRDIVKLKMSGGVLFSHLSFTIDFALSFGFFTLFPVVEVF